MDDDDIIDNHLVDRRPHPSELAFLSQRIADLENAVRDLKQQILVLRSRLGDAERRIKNP